MKKKILGLTMLAILGIGSMTFFYQSNKAIKLSAISEASIEALSRDEMTESYLGKTVCKKDLGKTECVYQFNGSCKSTCN